MFNFRKYWTECISSLFGQFNFLCFLTVCYRYRYWYRYFRQSGLSIRTRTRHPLLWRQFCSIIKISLGLSFIQSWINRLISVLSSSSSFQCYISLLQLLLLLQPSSSQSSVKSAKGQDVFLIPLSCCVFFPPYFPAWEAPTRCFSCFRKLN